MKRLASAQMSAVRIDPTRFPDLYRRQGLRQRQFRNQLVQSGDELPWLGLGRQVGNESVKTLSGATRSQPPQAVRQLFEPFNFFNEPDQSS